MINIYTNRQTKRKDLPTECNADNKQWTNRGSGTQWCPIPHKQVADTLIKSLKKLKIKVLDEKWGLAEQNYALVGGCNIMPPKNLNLPSLGKGIDYSIGLIHANNMKHSMKMTIGGQVSICTNGLATGEIVLQRKHTHSVKWEEEIVTGIKKYAEEAKNLKQQIDSMRKITLSETQVDTILMEAGRQHIMCFSRIGKVYYEFTQPSFDYVEKMEGTAWGLYNAFTHILKQSPIIKQSEAMIGFHNILKGEKQ